MNPLLSLLTQETEELLGGFESRMKFVNIIKYIKKHNITDEIKEFFPGGQDIMDNLVIAVLLFIMDSALRYGEKCTKKDISRFLGELSRVYGYPPDKSDILAEFIVTDVLRNGGRLVDFDTYISGRGEFCPQSVILLTDNNGCYDLTDEVYDLLFRTREIDTELDFSVSRFKLREFIRRGNYSKALSESHELVSRVHRLKGQMDGFILRCRTNISKVSADEYEEIIKQVKYAFEDESDQMTRIRAAVTEKLRAIAESAGSGISAPGAQETEREIRKILDNINIVIEEQTNIYNKKYSLEDIFGQLLETDFSYLMTGRFDFKKTISEPMQQVTADGIERLSEILAPLMRPRLPRYFSIENFFDRQKKLSDSGDEPYVDLTGGEENSRPLEDVRNERYTEIIRSLFSYIADGGVLRFSGFTGSLSPERLTMLNEENALLDVMLKLYAMGEIDIEGWKNTDKTVIVPSGEFDLSYALSEVSGELPDMKIIRISRLGEVCEFTDMNGMKIFFNDFEIEAEV